MAETTDKRKLSELRVVDLKHELEKRGKDGSGVKNVLLEKLTQALRDEGLNPETMEFEIVASKTPAKKGKAGAGNKTDEESGSSDAPSAEQGGEETGDTKVDENTNNAEADGAVEATEEEKVEEKQDSNAEKQQADVSEDQDEATEDKDPSDKEKTSKEEVKEELSENNTNGTNKEEFVKPVEPVAVVKSEDNFSKQIDLKDDPKEADNEDSLNLTIGEEDEKLLHDSNMEVDAKDEVESKQNNQGGDKVSDSTSEEPKKTDDKRDGKSEKSVAASSTEKELRKLRGR